MTEHIPFDQVPDAFEGVPIGLGDWRFYVQILLPEDVDGRWGVGKWGQSIWNQQAWQDLSPWVRGCSWSRGGSSFSDRPEVGVATITLANPDREFSAWNGVTAFRNGTVIGPDERVRPGSFGPGAIVRIVAFSPSGDFNPLTSAVPGASKWGQDTWGSATWSDIDALATFVPQFSGIVESWVDDTAGVGADSFVTVTVVETLTTVAQIQEAPIAPVGADESVTDRLQRLFDASGWLFGAVDSTQWRPALHRRNYTTTATTLEENRITEIYQAAESVGGVVRSGRDGRPIFYNSPDTGGLGSGIVSGPEQHQLEAISYQYEEGDSPDSFRAACVADSIKTSNDVEALINEVKYTNADGETVRLIDAESIRRYRQTITEERTDFVSRSLPLLEYLAQSRLAARSLNLLRLDSLTLHSGNGGTLPAIIGLDIGCQIDVHLPPLPTHRIIARANTIDGMSHNVTPAGDSVVWTVGLNFGVQMGIENIERTSP